jgi:hypothetical protein
MEFVPFLELFVCDDLLTMDLSTFLYLKMAAPTSIEVWSPVTIGGVDHQHSVAVTARVASPPSSADPFGVA